MDGEHFTWGDLLAIVQNLPESSALQRATSGPEDSPWTLTNHLLANMADTLNLLWWAKTDDAMKKPPRNRPKPLPRPGVADDSKKQIGSSVLPAGEMLDWLGWRAPDDISELVPIDEPRRTKLDPAMVRAIRSSDKNRSELAVEFAVSTSTIADVICGRTWKHVV